MISKKMGELDWAKSATELERLIRGLNPWPSAFFPSERKNFENMGSICGRRKR